MSRVYVKEAGLPEYKTLAGAQRDMFNFMGLARDSEFLAGKPISENPQLSKGFWNAAFYFYKYGGQLDISAAELEERVRNKK